MVPAAIVSKPVQSRLRQLDGLLESLRRHWVVMLGATSETRLLVDTKPIPVLGLKRDKRYSDFSGNATPGYCAARKLYYFGYKLTLLTTQTGIPIAYDLVPAHTNERQAVESVLEVARGCTIYGDKGFIDQSWQSQVQQRTGNQIWTLMRKNQQQQHSAALNRLISSVRQRIEGVFHEIQNTGRNPERLLNKTIDGLCVHIAAKIASHTLRLLLKRRFGIDVLTFQAA
ncbi:MAG: IS982 family transposase [Synechococcales bacterium]|nr:IS982 family transposase [Synechococcales bacterium]